jgi:sigma-E factor negative regulatory protein RseA
MNQSVLHPLPGQAAQLSALLDGELPDDALDALLVQWTCDTALAEEWDALQVACVSVRGTKVSASPMSTTDFLTALRPALQLHAPKKWVPTPPATDPVQHGYGRRWRRFGGFAGALGAVVLGWRLALPVFEPNMVVAQIDSAGNSVASINDEQLDALLAAHQQLGGSHSLQPSSGFFRQAVYVVSAR